MAVAAGFAAAETLLVARGAGQVAHPGGTLLEHLCRVRDRLAAWDAPPAVQLAGLCHAAYGTDGFPISLLAPDERPVLTGVIGAEAEWLVHLYGTCRRRDVYPQLGSPVAEFPDRVTGARRSVASTALRAFVEITAANEFDLVHHDAGSPRSTALPSGGCSSGPGATCRPRRSRPGACTPPVPSPEPAPDRGSNSCLLSPGPLFVPGRLAESTSEQEQSPCVSA